MRYAAKSMFYFAFYMILIGLMFLFIPEWPHTMAGIEPPNVMSRVFGLIILYLAYYYISCARKDEGMEIFFKVTVHTRASAIFVLFIFMLLGFAGPIIVVFGIVDFAGAMWTLWGLKKDAMLKAQKSNNK